MSRRVWAGPGGREVSVAGHPGGRVGAGCKRQEAGRCGSRATNRSQAAARVRRQPGATRNALDLEVVEAFGGESLAEFVHDSYAGASADALGSGGDHGEHRLGIAEIGRAHV